MDLLLARLRKHIAHTKANERGCIQFDILRPHEGNDTVHLYEVYEDEAAFDLHNASGRLTQYRSDTEPLLSRRTVTWCAIEE